MRTLPVALCLATLAVALCVPTRAHAAIPSPGAPAPASAPAPVLTAAQQGYLALARSGVAQAQRRWRDARLGWYDARLDDRERYPLATIWDIVPLFQALDAIAIADPTSSDRRAVAGFAAGAERYLNRGLRPLAGYSPYPGDREAEHRDVVRRQRLVGPGVRGGIPRHGHAPLPGRRAARAALHRHRRLGRGTEAGSGGTRTTPYKAGEALASGTLLATLLYQQTGSQFALGQALKFLGWANTSGPGGGFSSGKQLVRRQQPGRDADRLHRVPR